METLSLTAMPERKVITADSDSFILYLKKIWMFRSLIVTFAKRDIQIKYAQTFLGLVWTVVQPFIAILVYTLFFTFIVNIPTGKTNYILFVLSGLTLWSLFSYIFSQGSYVLLSNQEIIRKMSFPKIILVFSKVLVGLTEFAVSFTLLVIAWGIWSRKLSWKIMLLPLPVVGVILFALTVTILLLTFSLKRRDLLHVGPFFVNFGIWFTPVFYPVSLIPEKYKGLIYINPMASMIDFFRWTILDETRFSSLYIVGFFVILVLFIASVYLFKNVEDKIVDNL